MLSAHNAFQINITGIRAFRGYPLSPDSQSYPRNIDLQRLLERGHLPIAGRVPPMGTRCVWEGISNCEFRMPEGQKATIRSTQQM
jgi:hypothetical protein